MLHCRWGRKGDAKKRREFQPNEPFVDHSLHDVVVEASELANLYCSRVP